MRPFRLISYENESFSFTFVETLSKTNNKFNTLKSNEKIYFVQWKHKQNFVLIDFLLDIDIVQIDVDQCPIEIRFISFFEKVCCERTIIFIIDCKH